MDTIKSHCHHLDRCNQRGGRMLSIIDLLEAGTIDLETAAYLAAAVSSGRSFLVGAVPGGAGKTTVMAALLNFLPPDVPIIPAESSHTIRSGMKDAAPQACYLCHEIGSGHYYAYLWGREARDFFGLPRYGHVIATNLHADTIEQTHDQLCRANGVDESGFRSVGVMLFIALAGSGRRIATVWESDGSAPHHLVFRWDSENDSFQRAGDPLISSGQVEPFKPFIEGLVRENARTIQDVRSRVVSFLRDR